MIQKGQLEEALEELCAAGNDDAIVLLNDLRHSQKAHETGQIEYKDFELVRNRVSSAALKLV